MDAGPMPADTAIGQRLLTDGITRTVCRSPDDQQYLLDSDAMPVPGIWIYPDDEADMPRKRKGRKGCQETFL